MAPMGVHLDERDPRLASHPIAAHDEEQAAKAGAHTPPMDILEGPDRIEVRVDLVGVPATAVRVTLSGHHLRIAGHKQPPCPCAPGAARFHVAERTFGHFVRTIALRHAFDAAAITATLAHGELRIVIPRIADRRGREIEIPIETL